HSFGNGYCDLFLKPKEVTNVTGCSRLRPRRNGDVITENHKYTGRYRRFNRASESIPSKLSSASTQPVLPSPVVTFTHHSFTPYSLTIAEQSFWQPPPFFSSSVTKVQSYAWCQCPLIQILAVPSPMYI